jgi:hypothetical protein
MQPGGDGETGTTGADTTRDETSAGNTGETRDSVEGSELVDDSGGDAQQVTSARLPQASRPPTARNKRRGWSAIEVSTLALLHAMHGNKW